MSASRPSLADSLSKTINRARRRGLAEATAAGWGRLRSKAAGGGTLLVLDRATGGAPEHRPDATFRPAAPGDAEAYATEIATDSPRTFRARLSEQTRCYLVESRGRLLHASWVTTASAWTAELDAFISPPAGDAYVYESFTVPAARGGGLYPFALNNICADLASRGVPRAWIAVEASNAPSVRAIAKAGFELAFELTFHRRWGKVQVGPAIGARIEDVGGFVSNVPRT